MAPEQGRRFRLLLQPPSRAVGDAPAGDRRARRLCRQLQTWWPTVSTVSRVHGVEPTSNVAKRTLRQAVLWRKRSFATDSEAPSPFAERLTTPVTHYHQQGRPLLDCLVAATKAALRAAHRR
jgi:hypothetical protein